MGLGRGSIRRLGVPLLCLFFAFCASCESNDMYLGKYMAVPKDSTYQEKTQFELKTNGEGLWIVGDKEVAFSWYIKRGDLRVHTKEGGVLVGKIAGDTIKITLPMKGDMVFKKAQ